MERDNHTERDDGGFPQSAADASLLSHTSRRPSSNRAKGGWDPIPFCLLGYFFAAGTYFVAFNVWDMPNLPYPLVGNLLPKEYTQVPQRQEYINNAFLLLSFWGIHFLRRFFEVLYVHNYTHTMSAVEAVGVVVYYSFFGIWMGWSTNIFLDYFPPSKGIFAIGIIIFLVGEVGNCISHIQLKRLRSKNVLTLGDVTPRDSRSDHVTSPSGHVMPTGCIFSCVSSPHYLFEMITWLGFAIASFTLASFVFLFVSTVCMCVYARKRHVRYKQEFTDYPQKRKAIVPYIF